jgi:hypothetical protein
MLRKRIRIARWTAPLWTLVLAGLAVTVVFAAWLWITQSHVWGTTAAGVQATWGSPTCALTGPGSVVQCIGNSGSDNAPSAELAGIAPGSALDLHAMVTNGGAVPIYLQACPAPTAPGVTLVCPEAGIAIPAGTQLRIHQLYSFGSGIPSDSAVDFFQPVTFGTSP